VDRGKDRRRDCVGLKDALIHRMSSATAAVVAAAAAAAGWNGNEIELETDVAASADGNPAAILSFNHSRNAFQSIMEFTIH